MVVLFWLDLWEIFFLATLGFEPRDLWISSPALYHCATVNFWFSASDNFRYLTLVQRDWWWYCSDWTCERFSFWPPLGLNPVTLWISSPALHHCATDTSLWQMIFTSDNFRYLTLVQRDWWWYCSDWTCGRFSFWPHSGFEPGTSGSLVLHSTTVSQWLLIFTSDNFRYLTLVQRDWWWYCSDWTCERFSFWPHPGLNPETSGSLVLHSTTVSWWLLIFTSDNFRYLTLVQRDWWWYCSDWTCERFSFWPHQGLNHRPLDL